MDLTVYDIEWLDVPFAVIANGAEAVEWTAGGVVEIDQETGRFPIGAVMQFEHAIDLHMDAQAEATGECERPHMAWTGDSYGMRQSGIAEKCGVLALPGTKEEMLTMLGRVPPDERKAIIVRDVTTADGSVKSEIAVRVPGRVTPCNEGCYATRRMLLAGKGSNRRPIYQVCQFVVA